MISRYAIVCPGCGDAFTVRLGMAPTKMTRFYVPCPSCSLPIRGRSHGQELEDYKVDFVDAERYSGEDEPSSTVTVDPNVPSRYEASEMGGLGTAPTMTLHVLAGDRTMDLFELLGRGRQAAEELWPAVRRIYEYYLECDWAHFDKVGRETFGDDDWPSGPTTHERATRAHGALGVVLVLAALTGGVDRAVPTFMLRYLDLHSQALTVDSYLAFARADAESGALAALQRQTFDVVDHFVANFESWQIGLLRYVVPEESLPLLDELRLFRDEFDILRDLYQQGFETACKVLRYPMAAHNTVEHGSPNDFGTRVPSTLDRKSNPKSMTAYESLPNFVRLRYVAAVPDWAAWTNLLDNRTRNAIGHATARHDLRTGLVVNDDEPSGVPYLDVTADVFGVCDVLCSCIQVLRSIRVLSSPEFEEDEDD